MDTLPEGEEYVAYERYQESVRRYKKRVRAHEIRRRIFKWTTIGMSILLAGVFVWALSFTPKYPREWTFETQIRHLLAAPSCTAARTVGLAPAYRRAPGYWSHLDRDQDGIACEPPPRWRR